MRYLQRSLLKLLWLALNPDRALTDMPAGWAQGRFMDRTTLQCAGAVSELSAALETFFWGEADEFLGWLGAKFTKRISAFERSVIKSELEILQEFGTKQLTKHKDRQQLRLL